MHYYWHLLKKEDTWKIIYRFCELQQEMKYNQNDTWGNIFMEYGNNWKH